MGHPPSDQFEAGEVDAHADEFPHKGGVKAEVDSSEAVSFVDVLGGLKFTPVVFLSTMVLFLHQYPDVVSWCLFYTILTTDNALGIPVRTLAMRRVKSLSFPLSSANTFLKYRLKPN